MSRQSAPFLVVKLTWTSKWGLTNSAFSTTPHTSNACLSQIAQSSLPAPWWAGTGTEAMAVITSMPASVRTGESSMAAS